MNIAKKRADEKKGYVIDATEATNNGRELLKALEEYDKKTINKRFFEKYFTTLDDNGEVRKNYQGDIYTKYSFSPALYSFNKGKRISLGRNYNLEDIETTDRLELINLVKAFISQKQGHIDEVNKNIDELEAFDEKGFDADIKALWLKYGKPSIWSELLGDNQYIRE
jgi:hypothetical protein